MDIPDSNHMHLNPSKFSISMSKRKRDSLPDEALLVLARLSVVALADGVDGARVNGWLDGALSEHEMSADDVVQYRARRNLLPKLLLLDIEGTTTPISCACHRRVHSQLSSALTAHIANHQSFTTSSFRTQKGI